MGGMILGTAAYMAPEQARGKTVDKRADIWAFGLVLYEMLAGRTAFAGDTISDVLAAVLTREPDWTALPATTPASIKRLLARCLEKDPKRRLRDIGDARLEIEETIRESRCGGARAPVAAAPRVRPLAWTAAGFAVAAIAIVGLAVSGVWPRARTSETRPLRVSIVHTEGSEVGAPAISPDGRRVAYRARRSDGMPLLWVRDLASGEAQPLAGTEDASLPFWSPDSSDLGFFSGVSLKRVSAAGGPVRILVDYMGTYGGAGGTWSSDGTIVFSGQFDLFRVPANGGAVSIVTKAPTQDWSYYWPTFLPDGRRFLFTAKLWTRTAEASDQGIYIGSLDNPKIERLLPGPFECRVCPAWLSRIRPQWHAHRDAVRSGGGPRDWVARRDRRGRGDGITVLLRGDFGVGRRHAGGPATAGPHVEQPRDERGADGTASGRSRRKRQPRELSAALLVHHGTQPGGQPRRRCGDSRSARGYVGPVAGGPDEGHRRTADDDSRIRQLPRLVRRRQAHGLCVSTSRRSGRRLREGHRQRRRSHL